MSRRLPRVRLTPPPVSEFNPEPLPALPAGIMPDVAMATSAMTAMVEGLSATESEYAPYDFISPDHRHIVIPGSVQHPGRKLEGAPQAAYLLRLTLLGDQKYALDAENTLWVCWNGCWRPTTDLLAVTGGKGLGYDAFVRSILETYDGQLPRLQLGVRFDNLGLLRGGETVTPDDPRFDAPWAMEFEGEEYSAERAEHGLAMARTVTATDMDARMLCRVAAAPIMRDHLQCAYDLLGEGGNGKGLFLDALLRLYGDLGGQFSLADFAGIGKVSSTAYEQAGIPLTNHLLAADTDAPDPGLGNQERLKKATAGEGVATRQLGRDSVLVPTTAVIVIASNRAPSIASDPSQNRRWRYVNFDRTGGPVDRWRDALCHGNLALDLLMAGCVEWSHDPVGVNPMPALIHDLDDWGTEVLSRLLDVGEPDPVLGFDPHAYLPSSCVTVPECNRDKAAQLAMLGLVSRTRRDTERLAGDEARVCRCFVIAKPELFARFVAAVQPDSPEPAPAAPETEPMPEAGDTVTADGLRAARPLPSGFGGLETMLGAMRWKGNVFPLRGGGSDPKAPAVRLEPMLTDFEDFVADRCAGDEPMRGLAMAPGLMVLDLDVPKGKDAGKPDGLGVLSTLGLGLGDPALAVRTASGGYHLYYRIPDGVSIPQIAHRGASAPLPGLPAYEAGVPIDTRVGGKGYVVMPGSVLPDGRGWSVVHEGSSDGAHTLPDGLLRLLQRLAAPANRPARAVTPFHSAGPVDGSYAPHVDMTPVAEGARNDTMSRQVWGWLQRAREKGLSGDRLDRVLDGIRERFRASGLPDGEIEACIRRTRAKLGL